MSQRRAVGYSQVFTTTPAEAIEQRAAIERYAAEHGIELVDHCDDAEAGHNRHFERLLRRHSQAGQPIEIVAFDASRGRPMPELWRQVPCEKCGDLKTVAATDGELMAGCDLELC